MPIMGSNRNTLFFSALALIFCTGVGMWWRCQLHPLTLNALAQTATIGAGKVFQTIAGFGASTGYIEGTQGNQNMNATQAARFFNATSGIGLSWIRIQDCGSDTDCPYHGTTNSPDLPTLQYAVNNGAKVLITFDFPGGTPSNWSSYAAYVLSKIQYLQLNGVPVSMVSPANEPSNENNWTGSTLASFIDVLGPAMKAAGLNIPMTLPEWLDTSISSSDFYSACLSDSTCARYVTAYSQHGYSTWPIPSTGPMYNSIPSVFGSRQAWETEVNGNLVGPYPYKCGPPGNSSPPWDPSIADGIAWAENIWSEMVNQSGSAWMYWNLSSFYSGTCNDGLSDYNFNPAKRFYTLGNWSKFVRPGWVRIGATAHPQSGVYLCAFQNHSTGAFAIVAINAGGSSISQTFDLSRLSASSVTPYITDSKNNLASRALISVSGASFTATLTPSSVTTFVSSGNGPGIHPM